MRFAICNETFTDRSLEAGFEAAAQLGYEGVELAPFTLAPYITEVSPARRREIRQAIESFGLKTVGLHWLLAKTEGYHLSSPDVMVRRRTTEYLLELIRACAELGGNVLVFGSPQQRSILPGVERRQAEDYAVEVLNGLHKELERTGVVLALEPLSPQETNFLNTAEETVQLARRLGSPNIKLHLDCKAMSSESVPIPELLRRHRDDMAHFHANDPNRQGPGFGSLDFIPIFRALREIDYSGWVSVEVFDYTPGPQRLADESLSYMKRCLAALDASPASD
ncbi:sugar phosphate isomerase/epimerase family protein [Thermopirellula anaerolimosa]